MPCDAIIHGAPGCILGVPRHGVCSGQTLRPGDAANILVTVVGALFSPSSDAIGCNRPIEKLCICGLLCPMEVRVIKIFRLVRVIRLFTIFNQLTVMFFQLPQPSRRERN